MLFFCDDFYSKDPIRIGIKHGTETIQTQYTSYPIKCFTIFNLILLTYISTYHAYKEIIKIGSNKG
jgi:hypothetical protein